MFLFPLRGIPTIVTLAGIITHLPFLGLPRAARTIHLRVEDGSEVAHVLIGYHLTIVASTAHASAALVRIKAGQSDLVT